MGSRAHYAVIKAGSAGLRYSHWGAQHIDSDLLWGPDIVVPFIESMELDRPEHVLLDATWSEGAVVLNIDAKKLIVSGGDTIGADPELRRLWIRLLRVAWVGWDVSWGTHGISHVVEALGVERERVLGKLPTTAFDSTKLYTCHTQGRARMLLSTRDENGFEHYGFDAPVEYYLSAGEALIDSLHRCRLYSVSELERGEKLPEDAIYIDKTKRRLVVTLAPVFGFYDPRIVEMIRDSWSGWTVDMNYDGLRMHPECSGLDFRIPSRDEQEMLAVLRAALCVEPIRFTAASSRAGSGNEVTVLARHTPVALTKEQREERFDSIVQTMKNQSKS